MMTVALPTFLHEVAVFRREAFGDRNEHSMNSFSVKWKVLQTRHMKKIYQRFVFILSKDSMSALTFQPLIQYV